MKRIQTTVTEEYNTDGKIIKKITETVEEEDDKSTIYPYYPQTYPWWPTNPYEPVIYGKDTGHPPINDFSVTT